MDILPYKTNDCATGTATSAISWGTTGRDCCGHMESTAAQQCSSHYTYV